MKLLTPSRSASRSVTRRDVLKGSVAGAVALSLPRTSRGLILLGGSAQVSPGQSFDFYISTTGSDTNPGTLASPWAITSLSPYMGSQASTNRSHMIGKRVGLLPGTYGVSAIMTAAGTNYNNIALDLPAGSSGAPTYLASSDSSGLESVRTATIEANDNGIFGGGNGNKCSMIGHSGTGYAEFHGLRLTGASLWCLTIGQTAGTNSSPQGIVIKDCEIFGNSAQTSTITSGENCGHVQICSARGLLFQNNYCHDNLGYPGSIGEDHFSAIYQWGSIDVGGSGNIGNQYLYNTFVNTGGFQGKETGQWDTTIAYNLFDMSTITNDSYSFPICSAIIGCNDEGSGSGTLSSFHHNIVVGYNGAGNVSPSFYGGSWINPTYSTDSGGWSYPLSVYSNTIVAGAAMHGAGFTMFETSAGLKPFSFYNNLVYDGGVNQVSQYGIWMTNADAFSILDYNIYGTTFSAGKWASIASNGSFPNPSLPSLSSLSSLAAWQSSTGADTHSIAASSNPFTGVNTGLLASKYQLAAGYANRNFGHVGGTSGGAVCDVGAWDGIATQIGCNFA